jgi:hypothetical protein
VNPASGFPDGQSASGHDSGGGSGFRATVYLSIGLSAGTVPGSETRNDLTAIQLALAEAARRMTASGHPVRYLNGMYMPAQQRLLCVFCGESEETVLATVERVGLPYTQIGAITDPGTPP